MITKESRSVVTAVKEVHLLFKPVVEEGRVDFQLVLLEALAVGV